ncbi:unnamed protein product, partial [Didymodactylos carnosus]
IMTSVDEITLNENKVILNNLIPKYNWNVRFDKRFDQQWKPFLRPRPNQVLEYIPLLTRYMKYYLQMKKLKRRPRVPIGGLGCGTIGRGFRGEFCRYQLCPGLYEFQIVEANTFTVCVRRHNLTTYTQVLTPYQLTKNGFQTWKSAYPKECGNYYGLYPQSWTVYDLPGQNIKLLCKQLSPVIPHDYKDSSLPIAVFDWYIENLNDEPVEVSLMFIWQSGSASQEFSCTNVTHEFITTSHGHGFSINQLLREMKLEYCVVAKQESDNSITVKTNFDPDSEKSGQALWYDLISDGQLDENQKEFPQKSSVGTASCVCVQTTVQPQEIKTTEFVLAWHMPIVKFGCAQESYKRWYTKFFNESELCGAHLCSYAMESKSKWEIAIQQWQQPILDDEELPDWYKSALFNELYFVSDGGTVWFDVSNDEKVSNHIRKWGRFAYLEGQEYRMYNTYDVHFYASFALIMNWPELELSIQYDFADTIYKETEETRIYLFHGSIALIKSLHCIPHDLGDPDEEPWLKLNAYSVHDTSDWKDLNIKYLLQIYRDYVYTKNKQFLIDVWPTVKLVTDRIKTFDTDGDGLVDNGGFADQTYDAWKATGASAYCGGLHVASLRACIEMARVMNDLQAVEEYDMWLEKAKKSLNEKLWNGQYYDYDSSQSRHHNSIMSDQLSGFWYLRLCGHQYEEFDKEHVDSILHTIFKINVMQFGDGKLGAVNGMTSDGQLETASIQSEEVWTGVNYSLSATMIMEVSSTFPINMTHEAFLTSEGIYNTCYNLAGLSFQTPEALMKTKTFRSCGYMRALAIWSMQKAIELTRSYKQKNHIENDNLS